jgi:hypothetical protein
MNCIQLRRQELAAKLFDICAMQAANRRRAE